ncbi:MAG TPA: hypothetical protein EYG80_00590 [Flavobacteriaceae bacterium]|nr:hypothetical protein [Flavobacteriaceae bacterium]
MSKLFWAVMDESQKQKTEEILATFDKDSKDEMGLMNITISLSSLMFPGTSVLHTRLRYIYLVGWIFLEALKSKKEFTTELLHKKEKELRKILQEKKKEDKEAFVGILGSTKIVDNDGDGEELSQPPFSVYFNLLKEWKIIKDDNLSVSELYKESFCPKFIEIIEDDSFRNDTFELIESEKEYIVKKIPKSILSTIFDSNIELEQKQHFVDFDIELIQKDAQRKLFKYAQNFSLLMWGTMLYYNYYLGNESDDLKKRLDIWKERVKDVVDSDWKPSKTLDYVTDKINSSQIEFISKWYEYVKQNKDNLNLENPEEINKKSIEIFLTNREQHLKGNRSRLLKKQKGDILEESKFGISPIQYRWSNIVRFKKDFDATS